MDADIETGICVILGLDLDPHSLSLRDIFFDGLAGFLRCCRPCMADQGPRRSRMWSQLGGARSAMLFLLYSTFD